MKSVIKVDKTYSQLTGESFTETTQLSQFQILQILQNKEYYYNIWRNLILTEEQKSEMTIYEIYVVKENDFWENISWEIYKTVYYWWVIAFFNDIINPFESLYVGQQLRILNIAYVPAFLKMINGLKLD